MSPREFAEEDQERLTLDEVRSRVESLTTADFKMIERLAHHYAVGTCLEAGDLVCEAFVAVLCDRTCAGDVDIVVYLAGVMKSVAYARRRSARRSAVGPFAPNPETVENLPDEIIDAEAAIILTEEENAMAKVVQKISDALTGDEQAQLCLAGWAEGYRGAELRDFIGVDQATLDYVGKKIRRTAKKLFPNGWRYEQ
jgi:DNA-directed RNA polymerase specialized sigma24 family protein